MPISFPITLPTSPVSQTIRFRKNSVVALGVSPFSLSAQAQINSGQQWLGSYSLPPMTREQAEPWVAALSSLNGLEGSFLLGDPACSTPRGVATGTPLVKGGSQTGTDLITDGWTAGVTNIMRKGDWVQLGSGSSSRLYKNLVDVNSNGAGEATLVLWPKLRSPTVDNAPLVVNGAVGKFMLAQDLEWSIDEARMYGIQFEFMEDLRA